VHRDLKPANVMLTPTLPKIFDFGIASVGASDQAVTTTITHDGRLVGSISYMSPEQVKGHSVDSRSDIFAFGCLLYEMSTGRRAFARDTELATLAAVLESEPQPVQELAPDMPAGVAAVVSQCLQKDRQKRFQDATRVDVALRAAAVSRSDAAAQRTPKATRARARVAIALAAVLALAGIVAYYVSREPIPPSRLARDSVAVLPFSGPQNDTDIGYIADGLAESVTNSLSRLSGIRVAPRSKAFAYKGNSVSVEEAGRALGVQTIVMGSVARAGTRIRVQAELVDVQAGTQLWGQQFEGSENDLLRMQTELTRMVSQRLTSGTGAAATARMQAGSTVDPKAYQAYLRGRHAQFSLGDYQKANAYFREALAIDPSYALAYAGLAISYVDGLPSITMERAKAAALRALDIDSSVAEGHLALGLILGWYEFDWAAAEQSLKRALDLQPDDALTHIYYGWLLLHTGRGNEGIAQGQAAFGLDPLNPYIEMAYAQMHYACGQPQVAIERLRSLLSSSDFKAANWALAYAHMMKAEWREAIRVLDVFRSAIPAADLAVAIYGAHAYKQLGDVVRSRQLLSEGRQAAERVAPQSPSIAYVRAALAAVSGQREDALEWLRRAIVERDSAMPFNLASVDPVFTELRSDPRYLAITTQVTKAGLTPCQAPPDAASISTRQAPPR
jgi:serine/threonine-protein kinase